MIFKKISKENIIFDFLMVIILEFYPTLNNFYKLWIQFKRFKFLYLIEYIKILIKNKRNNLY